MRYYKRHFEGKTIFCNCDDPFESNFFKYFAMNFNHLKLKKLICVGYEGSPVSYTELKDSIVLSPTERKPYKIEITEVPDMNNDGSVDLVDVEILLKSGNNNLTILEGDGDFRSEESIEYLKEADIVVTNPPFSLFREYVAQLIEYDKKFLIIGNLNAVTYKEIFPLIKDNKMWLGCSLHATKCSFYVPDSYEGKSTFFQNGHKMAKVNNAVWFTNLDIAKRHEEIILYKKYNPEDYPKYDNYDAIEVSRVSDIPCDYFEDIGVPITFLDRYNPDQFEIIDINPHFYSIVARGLPKPKQLTLNNVGRKDPYARILIKRRKHEN